MLKLNVNVSLVPPEHHMCFITILKLFKIKTLVKTFVLRTVFEIRIWYKFEQIQKVSELKNRKLHKHLPQIAFVSNFLNNRIKAQ